MTDLPERPDQQIADSFLQDFVRELSRIHGPDIDFVLLFGSAARGEFVLGKSDVDLVIQVKREDAVRAVEDSAVPLFWQLDQKHGTQFKRVLSTGEAEGYLESLLKSLEKQARLYKPFEVFGPRDIDWSRGKIRRLDLLPGATFVASQLTLLYKMKHEGVILFGRDIRPEIHPHFSWWEKLKAVWVPQTLAFSAIILAPLLPQKAVGYATKAIFYELDSVNLFLSNQIPAGEAKLEGFFSATGFRDYLLDDLRFYLELKLDLLSPQKREFVRTAARIKREGFAGSGREALYFCLKAFQVIFITNAAAILKAGSSL
ncbi:MAG: nucleotidyltransferase domain-containing protein [Methanotrichaceae archaeon]|nr:nucleotidyltransferase domain-containing protein [Methanotrichaceae archaeon]